MPKRTSAKKRTPPGKGKEKRKTRSRADTSPATRSRFIESSSEPAIENILVDEGLTPAQLVFVETLCADPTKPAVEAARKAYPDQKPETHYQTAYENLRKPEIQKAVQRRLNPLLQKTRTSREAVTRMVGDGMHWDPADIFTESGGILPIEDWPIECRRQLAGIEVDEIRVGTGAKAAVIGHTKKVKFLNRTDFVTLGARMNKMLVDKLEVEDKTGIAERLKRAEARVGKGAKVA